ncbi:STAS domain-containing protein [Streptomyces sp. NPDC088400]|uniref:STAS domain-containing protein n=1 Tax=Streptomyces sp. NPDC088400 TaxID=3365861 RepID=UPI003811DC7B
MTPPSPGSRPEPHPEPAPGSLPESLSGPVPECLPEPLAFVVTTPRPDTVEVRLDGEMDYETSYEVVDSVRSLLRTHRGVRRLELHCGGLTMCDSMGLAALLMIRRLAEADDVQLLLTERQPMLERLLEVTGTMGHLNGTGDEEHEAREKRSPSGDGRPG